MKRLKQAAQKTIDETNTQERLWGRGSTLRVSKLDINLEDFGKRQKEEQHSDPDKPLPTEEKVSRSLIFIVWYLVAQIIVSVVLCRAL